MTLKKKIIWAIIAAAVIVIAAILTVYFMVSVNAKDRIYDSVADIPYNRVGLFLATSPITSSGTHNFHFENRIKAADELFKAGKIDTIIASGGDYRTTHKYGCDEPQAILDSLTARGIPADRIILDYNGQRTIKSISNAKEIYGLDSLTIISQEFHNQRAIYLADHFGLQTIAYNAAPPPDIPTRLKNLLRESLARPKMLLDLLHSQPRP